MFWYGAGGPGEMMDFLKENHSNIFFYGNKILKAKKEVDDNWVNAYTALATTLKDFVLPRAGDILNWTGKDGDAGAKAYYEAECKKVCSSTASAAPKQEEEKKQAPVANPAAAAGGVKGPKPPVKQKVINKWTIENYTTAETLKFEGE